MLKIAVDTVMSWKAAFEWAVVITVFKSSTDFTFLNVSADFDSVIILLTVEALNESAVIMIELVVLKLTVKEQFIVNQQINLYWYDDIYY